MIVSTESPLLTIAAFESIGNRRDRYLILIRNESSLRVHFHCYLFFFFLFPLIRSSRIVEKGCFCLLSQVCVICRNGLSILINEIKIASSKRNLIPIPVLRMVRVEQLCPCYSLIVTSGYPKRIVNTTLVWADQ